MNPSTAKAIVRLLHKAGAARLERHEAALLMSLEHGLIDHVAFDADVGPETLHNPNGRSLATIKIGSGAVVVSFQYTDRPPAIALEVAVLHTRVARLALLIQAVIDCDDRIAAGAEDVLVPLARLTDDLESWLTGTDGAYDAPRSIRAALGLS